MNPEKWGLFKEEIKALWWCIKWGFFGFLFFCSLESHSSKYQKNLKNYGGIE